MEPLWTLKMPVFLLLILVGLAPNVVKGEHTPGLPAESRLMSDLLEQAEKFGKHGRPLSKPDVALNVSFGIRVVKVNVDAKQSELSISVWCRLRWFDENLVWNASNYEGLKYIYLPSEKLWTPDVTLVNSAKSMHYAGGEDGMVSVRYDGRMFWTPYRVFSVPCLFTLQDYPWDRYTCDMWFQSLGYSSQKINLLAYRFGSSPPFDMDTYLGSFREWDEWDIVRNLSAEVDSPRSMGVILMYSRRRSLRMTLVLERRTGFMAILLTFPCIVFSVMSCLVFCIPPTRPDRLGFGTSLFSAFMVFMLILAASVPPTSGAFPKLGIFYGFNSLLIIVAIILSVLNINLSKRRTSLDTVPPMIDKIFLRTVGPLLLIPPTTKPRSSCYATASQRKAEISLSPWFSEAGGFDADRQKIYLPEHNVKNDTQSSKLVAKILHNLEEVSKKVEAIQKKLGGINIPSTGGGCNQWENLVNVLDRLFITMYCFAIFLGLCFIFPWPKSH